MAAPSAAGLTLVTGASGALGRALVEVLSARGHSVVAAGREGGVAGEWPPQVLLEPAADLSRPEPVEDLFSRVDRRGELVAVVNAVGAFRGGSLAGGDPAAFSAMLEANLEPAWWISRESARRLAARGGGAIVHVSSRAALTAGEGSAAYTVAKAAVVRMCEALARELATSRVRVNSVLPGVIDTPANRRWMTPAQLKTAVPPSAIAEVVAFLLSAEGWPISGASLPVYGWS